jgi:hypothetical protein
MKLYAILLILFCQINWSFAQDKMYISLNNLTNGRFGNNQIYWCIVGYDKQNQLVFVDRNGNLVRANTNMNTINKNGRWAANICYTLEQQNFIYIPDIQSGRMYVSLGEQVYLTFNMAADGRVGYAGPDLNNPTDPNQDVLFEFLEFTIINKEFWGNTSRVDFFSFPIVAMLWGNRGWTNGQYYEDYFAIVGDQGNRDQIFNAFRNEVPNEFKTLVTYKRILAPCKKSFNRGAQYEHYFDNYINEFWNKYTYEDLVFSCDAGTFRGRVNGNAMRFTCDGSNKVYTIYKPTTQDVLEGKGNFNRGNARELVIEAQLCAAFNRGVATEPHNYNNEWAYYRSSVANHYSGFFHNHAIDRFAYGFCYDDVFDHSTLLHFTNPTGLNIELRW